MTEIWKWNTATTAAKIASGSISAREVADVVAPSDSPLVSHLKSAGAVIIGRTNTPEMSYRWHAAAIEQRGGIMAFRLWEQESQRQ